MRSYFAGKFWVAVVALLGLVALTGLALGLRSMSFRAGQGIGRDEVGGSGIQLTKILSDAVTSVPLLTQLMVIVLIILIVVLIGMLMSPEGRKRLFRILFRVVVTYLIIYLLVTRYPDVLEQFGLALAPSADGAAASAELTPPPVFTPPNSVSGLSYLISFGIAVVLAFGAWKIYTIWRELNTPPSTDALKRLGNIARASLRDLSSGGESADVILGCYYRMSEVVSQNKNLDRHASMTPAEFATRLERAGLPSDAVRQLTRLFESVRYGGYQSSPKMINEAVACLTTILNYCGDVS